MGWKAPQLIDYAAQLKTDSLFITDLAFRGTAFSDAKIADLLLDGRISFEPCFGDEHREDQK